MRKRIKELLHKEEGFTLVELLAVIVILGIIIAIAIPAVGSVISNTQEDATEAEQDLVVDAGRLYFSTSDNKDDTWVTVGELLEAGYLEDRADEESSTLEEDHGVSKKTAGNTVTYSYETAEPAS